MFESQSLQNDPALCVEALAVETAKDLYLKCLELGSGNLALGLGLISLAMRHQAGEFGDDTTEFDRRVATLLTEVKASNTTVV